MENPFNKLTTLSVCAQRRPLPQFSYYTCTCIDGTFIKFDNSEDAFYPQNDTTELLYEIEERYQASLDFIRVIDEIEQGDMHVQNGEQFASSKLNCRPMTPFFHIMNPVRWKFDKWPCRIGLVLVEHTRSDNNANMARRSFNALANTTVASEENFTTLSVICKQQSMLYLHRWRRVHKHCVTGIQVQ